MTKETLLVFKELLNQVAIKPYQDNADVIWEKLKKAREEVEEELKA